MGMTTKQIADACDLPYSTVSFALHGLKGGRADHNFEFDPIAARDALMEFYTVRHDRAMDDLARYSGILRRIENMRVEGGGPRE